MHGRSAFVVRRCRAGASARPAPGDLVLLGDAGFVGEPDFHGAHGNAILARGFLQAGGEGHLGKSRSRPQPAHGAAAGSIACDSPSRAVPCSASASPPRRGTPPRANGRDRASLDRRGQRGTVGVGQPRRRARRPAVDQALRPCGIEPRHPVPDDLQRDRADSRCLGARRAVVDHRQSQQTPRRCRIPGSARLQPQRLRIMVRATGKRLAHGEALVLAGLNRTRSASGKTLRESWPQGFDIVVKNKSTCPAACRCWRWRRWCGSSCV